jgi:hypothetical protein
MRGTFEEHSKAPPGDSYGCGQKGENVLVRGSELIACCAGDRDFEPWLMSTK